MTASNKNKRKSPTAGKSAAAGSRQERSGNSAKTIFSELRELRKVMEKSTDAYTHIADGLTQQNRSIVSIAEAMKDVKEALQHVEAGTKTFETAHAAVQSSTTVGDEMTAEYDTHGHAAEEGVSSGEWNDIRAAFLAEHSEAEAAEAIDEIAAEEVNTAPQANEDDELDKLLEQLPCAVEPTSEDADELQRAVIDRDRTISVLVRRLQKQNRGMQTLTADQLADLVDNVPDELAQRVEASLQAVNQQVRLGELELSLERARVSRQLSKLEETRTRLESNARCLGLTIAEDGTIEGAADLQNKQGSKGRRWLGVLGFGN